ncbi:hypothetical protein [Flagellimonas zhangzhouensis]|uniref:hypothetical protein n=1 Tax=Flagellimonas zhangzhouensis TaxID=1073328 RepID=UPI000B7C9ED8|nr:hypothetical protein [Allomuricauda zhangzhouensis]
MLDQSFSQENFKKIFEIENRRGNFEKTFYSDQFHRLSGELKKQRAIIKAFKGKGGQDDDSLAKLIDEKKEIEKAKKK